jgi:hypothetical protein
MNMKGDASIVDIVLYPLDYIYNTIHIYHRGKYGINSK